MYIIKQAVSPGFLHYSGSLQLQFLHTPFQINDSSGVCRCPALLFCLFFDLQVLTCPELFLFLLFIFAHTGGQTER